MFHDFVSIYKKLNSKKNLISLMCLSLMIGIVILLTLKARIDQIIFWNFLFSKTPSVATPDAMFYLKEALIVKTNFYSFFEYFNVSLLSILVAFVSKSTQFEELLWAGNMWVPVFSAITALSIGFTAWYRGNAGLFPWFIGFTVMLTPIIQGRTGASYIDTDLLNIFFVYFISSILYFYGSQKIKKNNSYIFHYLFFSAFNFLFWWWYHHALFSLIFIMQLLAIEIYLKTSLKKIFQRFIFLLFLNGFILKDAINSFVGSWQSYVTKGSAQFRNIAVNHTFNTIDEIHISPWQQWSNIIFKTHFDLPLVGLGIISVSILGIFLWVLKDRLRFIAYFAAISFIPLSFFYGDRFYIYSVPVMWIGLYFAAYYFFEYLFKKQTKPLFNIITKALPAVMILILTFWNYSPICVLGGMNQSCLKTYGLSRFPDKDLDNVTRFIESNKVINQENNTLLTWWDYGHHFHFFSKMHLVHDNGSQNSLYTHLYADAMLMSNESHVSTLLKKLSNYTVQKSEKKIRGNDYILVNLDLLSKAPAFKFLAISESIRHSKFNPILIKVSCKKESSNLISCNDFVFNSLTGHSDKKNLIKEMIFFDSKGHLLERKKISDKGKTIVLNFSGNKDLERQTYTMSPWYFDSMFMKLYLGLADKKYFELIYDDYPNARLYKLQ